MTIDNLATGLIILGIIIIVFMFKRLKQVFLNIFGGSIDKVEMTGILFTIEFIRMLEKEGSRTSEWHLYSELYIFVVAGGALTGMGLGKVLDHIKELRSTTPSTKETSISIKENNTSTTSKMETKETKNDTEAPQ